MFVLVAVELVTTAILMLPPMVAELGRISDIASGGDGGVGTLC